MGCWRPEEREARDRPGPKSGGLPFKWAQPQTLGGPLWAGAWAGAVEMDPSPGREVPLVPREMACGLGATLSLMSLLACREASEGWGLPAEAELEGAFSAEWTEARAAALREWPLPLTPDLGFAGWKHGRPVSSKGSPANPGWGWGRGAGRPGPRPLRAQPPGQRRKGNPPGGQVNASTGPEWPPPASWSCLEFTTRSFRCHRCRTP